MAHVNEALHRLPAIHTFNPQWNESYAFTPQPQFPQSFIVLWPVLISHPAESRRLSWPGWPITYRDGIPA